MLHSKTMILLGLNEGKKMIKTGSEKEEIKDVQQRELSNSNNDTNHPKE